MMRRVGKIISFLLLMVALVVSMNTANTAKLIHTSGVEVHYKSVLARDLKPGFQYELKVNSEIGYELEVVQFDIEDCPVGDQIRLAPFQKGSILIHSKAIRISVGVFDTAEAHPEAPEAVNFFELPTSVFTWWWSRWSITIYHRELI